MDQVLVWQQYNYVRIHPVKVSETNRTHLSHAVRHDNAGDAINQDFFVWLDFYALIDKNNVATTERTQQLNCKLLNFQ